MVSSAIQAWGGTVEKYIGDAVVAVFGVPRIREDDAARATSAAVEITERVADLAAELQRERDVRLAIRIGLNTGDVIAPTEVRQDRPMVTGDAVNVAARLQAAAGPGEILVGDRTFQATRTAFAFEPPVELSIRGRSGSVVAHRIVGRIAGAFEAGPVRNLRARVVGRERELAVLGGLLDEAIETRSPRLAIVYGPAGIGKSRLVREAVDLASSERPDAVALRGRCPSVGQGITYWPLAEIVRSACGISLDDDADEAESKLRGRTSALLGRAGVPPPDIEATIMALAMTAGISIADNPLDRSRPLAVSVELGRRWPQFISALAAHGQAIVVVEDIHWASDRLLDMIERVLARSTGANLIVVTARPEFAEAHPSFAAGRSDVVTMALRPLSRSQSSGLLDGLLPHRNLDPVVEDEILATAEGNPLFIEEIVSRLIETGALSHDEDGWTTVGSATGITVPDTIHGLLAARIDGLPEAERRVLREAAVVGRTFWEEPVAAAVGGDATGDPLSELERRGLVTLHSTSSLSGQVEYAFKHALIRDVAYAGLSLARRARAHAAVAAWLGGLSRDRPEELAELIAFHYEQALGDGADLAWPAETADSAAVRRRAMDAFLVAGVTARKRYSLDRAIALHERAIALAAGPEDRARALEALGDDHDAAYDGDRALPPWEESLALRRESPGSGPDIARLSMKAARMGAILWGSFGTPMEPDVIDRYVRTGLAAGPAPEIRAWLDMLGAAAGVRWTAFHRPDPVPYAERTRSLDAARAYAEQAADTVLEANVMHIGRALLIVNGDIAGAIAATRRQLVLGDVCDDLRERHLGLIEAANTLTWVAGEAAEMLPTVQRALVIARDLRPHDVNHSTMTTMSARYLTGGWAEIPALVEEHIAAFEAQEDSSCPFAMGGFPLGATVLARSGDPERARAILASMPVSDAPIGMVEALQAMATLALGDASAARAMAQRVIDSGIRNFAEEPRIELMVLLDALVELEDWDAIRSALPQVRDAAGYLALAGPAADRAEGLAAAAAGSTSEAVALLQRAIEGFDRLSTFDAARTREMLAAVDPRRRTAAARGRARHLRAARCRAVDHGRALRTGGLGRHVSRPPGLTQKARSRSSPDAICRTVRATPEGVPSPWRWPTAQVRAHRSRATVSKARVRLDTRRPSSSSMSPRSMPGPRRGRRGPSTTCRWRCRRAGSASWSDRPGAARRPRSRWSTGSSSRRRGGS